MTLTDRYEYDIKKLYNKKRHFEYILIFTVSFILSYIFMFLISNL